MLSSPWSHWHLIPHFPAVIRFQFNRLTTALGAKERGKLYASYLVSRSRDPSEIIAPGVGMSFHFSNPGTGERIVSRGQARRQVSSPHSTSSYQVASPGVLGLASRRTKVFNDHVRLVNVTATRQFAGLLGITMDPALYIHIKGSPYS